MTKPSISNTPETDAPSAGAQERRQLLHSSTWAAAAALFGIVSACGGGGDDSNAGSGGKGNAGSGALGGGSSAKGGASNAAGDNAGGAGGAGSLNPNAEHLNTLLASTYHMTTAYTAITGLISDAPATDPLITLREVLVQIVTSVQAQHRLHASRLVEELGAEAISEASVVAQFTAPPGLIANTSISNALKFVAGAERDAAVLGNRTLSEISDPELRALASSIEGNQTQHFVLLAALVAGLVVAGPNLDKAHAATLFPAAFAGSAGKNQGLDTTPPDYFP